MASGKVDIILKAVDEYSNVLTGLNQGFELTKNVLGTLTSAAGMAFDAVKSGAEFAFRGVTEAVDLAVKGGNYQELYNQLSNVADHFKVDADAVMGTLDDLTDNVISMTDSVRLASKGIAAGFDKEELDAVFTFAKRRTEATGESFEMMAEQIINAMQKGRYTTLADMGLIIEKGMDTADILKEIERATEQYGDTGYNTGDKIASLSNQIDKFWTRVGQAINASSSWEASITGIQEAVIDFVNDLDYSAITRFTDGAMSAFSKLIGSTKFGSITDAFNAALNKMADAANSPTVQAIGDKVFSTISGAFGRIKDADYTGTFNSIAYAVERIAKPMGIVASGANELNQTFSILEAVVLAVSETIGGGFTMAFDIIDANIAAVQSFGGWLGKLSIEAPLAISKQFESISSFVNESIYAIKRFLGLLPDDAMVFDVGDTLSYENERQRLEALAQEQAWEGRDAESVEDLLASANWPAEFQALGSFLFQWVLSAASGSTVPMAITTAR